MVIRSASEIPELQLLWSVALTNVVIHVPECSQLLHGATANVSALEFCISSCLLYLLLLNQRGFLHRHHLLLL